MSTLKGLYELFRHHSEKTKSWKEKTDEVQESREGWWGRKMLVVMKTL